MKVGVAVGGKVKVGLGSAVSVGRLVTVVAGVAEAQALMASAKHRTRVNLKSDGIFLSSRPLYS